ncbi:hypothetical protein K450DRAFT_229089 [Umbelopsis ramanniana AG]|uniref:Uncharacterized protein n=1 Tax=Umbelopsis ramanniana AG TaxID=1314678 RepID=A0AAD5EFR5_UMBRA|nr:uncharacterized protein K450DRAFT_229089 [Umbelopsis ramanniana AG]KAI8582116.1 hypothetical protein K450DRAFT_229089 [Umbelopsis ramanniana AG]
MAKMFPKNFSASLVASPILNSLVAHPITPYLELADILYIFLVAFSVRAHKAGISYKSNLSSNAMGKQLSCRVHPIYVRYYRDSPLNPIRLFYANDPLTSPCYINKRITFRSRHLASFIIFGPPGSARLVLIVNDKVHR